jgi:glycine betaine/proline transport system substrate-binding protein
MKKQFWLTLVALALVAAACGGDADTTTTAGGTETTAAAGDNPTINIVANPWTASMLNAEVAKQLIESELGYPVEIVAIDENTMFTGMSDGSLDAALEIWPSGVTEDEQAFFDDGSVLNIGELGTVGKIGWFVPSYLIEEHPELATWEGFADPDNAALIFSGSEAATVADLDARVAAQEPIVMYWWTPTAAVAKYDLVNVLLPEYSEECYADPAAIACDYPEDVLIKAASAQLGEKAPEVLAFLEAFTITTEDQLSMLPAVEIDGEDAADVAARWITENEAVWSAWLG